MKIYKNSSSNPGQAERSPPTTLVGNPHLSSWEVNAMKNYSTRPAPARRPDDRELADVLTAISVVSRRLARKLTAASYPNNTKTEYECPLRQERKTHHEAL